MGLYRSMEACNQRQLRHCPACTTLWRKRHPKSWENQESRHQGPGCRLKCVTISGAFSAQLIAETAGTATIDQQALVSGEHSLTDTQQNISLIVNALREIPYRKPNRDTPIFHAQLSQFAPKTARTFVLTSNMLHF